MRDKTKWNKNMFLRVLLFSIGIAFVLSLVLATYSLSISDPLDRIRLTNPYAPTYQQILESFIRKGHPGVGVLIRTPEEGIWNGSAGYARLEDRTPISPGNLFYSLSCTKGYIATAIMILWEEGRINLDTCIDQYLPGDICNRIANGHSATVRHLLTHTSGIPDSDEDRPIIEIINDPLSWTWRDDLEGIYGMPALFPSGTDLEYRASNYILLAVIMDQLTGDHARFLSTRIFQPLGLVNTYYKLEPELPCPPKLVDLYFDRYGDGNLENISDVICEFYHNVHRGSSGIIADLADSALFMESLMDGHIVGPDALEIITAPSFPGFEWRGMGIGIIDFRDNEGFDHRFYEMAGSGMEGLAQTRYFPAEGVTISTGTNVGSTNRPNAHDHFNELLYDLTDAVFNGRINHLSSEMAKEKKITSDKEIIH